MKRTFSLIVLMAVMCSCLAMTAHAAAKAAEIEVEALQEEDVAKLLEALQDAPAQYSVITYLEIPYLDSLITSIPLRVFSLVG